MILGRTTDGKIQIKTDGGLRAVECGCCGGGEPGCCMYPADQLGTLYTAADLPDAVTVNWSGRYTGSMSKSGSGYAANGYTLDAQSGLWVLSDTATSTTRTVGNCLIRGDGGLTANGDLVEDQFSGSYVMNYYGFVSPLTRNGLCSWFHPEYFMCEDGPISDPPFVGFRYQGGLYYQARSYTDGNPLGWVLSVDYVSIYQEEDGDYWCISYWGFDFGEKAGAQNSPVGDYYLYDTLVATVSES